MSPRANEEQIDVVILTAIKLEYDEVLKVDAGARPGSSWAQGKREGLPVASREFIGRGGRPLRVLVARPGAMGMVAAVAALVPLLRDFAPRCVAMTGVCAGRPGKTALGDVVAAEKLFFHDTGKQLDAGRIQQDLHTFNLRADWRVDLEDEAFFHSRFRDQLWWQQRPRTLEWQEHWVLERLHAGVDPTRDPSFQEACPQWKDVIAALWSRRDVVAKKLSLTRRGTTRIEAFLTQHTRLPDPSPGGDDLPFRVHVASLGSGNKVVEDPAIWSFVTQHMRKTLALEMEAAALGALAESRRHLGPIDAVVMKGVMDFANPGRDDHFKQYAARASAECMIAFLREHLPEDAATHAAEEARPDGAAPSIQRIHGVPSPARFIGRADALTRLRSVIETGRDPDEQRTISLISIWAPGGMGKSTLADRLVGDAAWQRRFTRAVWFSFYARQTRDVASFMAAVGKELGIDLSTDTVMQGERDHERRLGRAREALCAALDAAPTLLVLDGVETTQDLRNQRGVKHGAFLNSHAELAALLRHVSARDRSLIVVTTRTRLAGFASHAGHLEFELSRMDDDSAATLLVSLGVTGTRRELETCAKHFQGHPLGLRAAGLYMERHGISARNVTRLIGDPVVFAESDEGERLIKIVQASRGELTDDQRTFVQMLSIPTRAVTRRDLPVLTGRPAETPEELDVIRREIIDPLVTRGFVDLEDGPDGEVYSAHPLMKVAFSRWFDTRTCAEANRKWAKAAVRSPDDVFFLEVRSPERLEQIVFAVERYLAAGDHDTAWEIYDDRGPHPELHRIGALAQQMEVTQMFADAFTSGGWAPSADVKHKVLQCLGYSHYKLDEDSTLAEELLQRASDVAREAKLATLASRTDLKLAQIRLWNGDMVGARALLAALPADHDDDVVKAQERLESGDYDAAIKLLRATRRREPSDRWDAQTDMLFDAYLETRDVRRAAALLRAFADKVTRPLDMILYTSNRRSLAVVMGKLDEARTLEAERHRLRASIGLPADDKRSVRQMVAEGRHSDVLAQVEADHRSPRVAARVSAAIASAAAHLGLGDRDAASRHLREGQALMQSSGWGRLRAWAEELAAELQRTAPTTRRARSRRAATAKTAPIAPRPAVAKSATPRKPAKKIREPV